MIRVAVLLAALASSTALSAAPVLSPAWTDHAVIQRDQPIIFEGKAAPGETVAATLGGESAQAQADAQGRFALRFAPRPASADPVSLTLNGAVAARDLLVGDVWLCSGQSNMEMQTERTLNSWGEVNGSADPQLRLLQVPKFTSAAPAESFGKPIAWTAATPETVGPFSAACYHMAKNLRRSLKVPVGAIHSSWGGSQARAWVTPESGRRLYGASDMDLLTQFATDELAAATRFGQTWGAWYKGKTGGSTPWLKPDTLAWQPVPAIGYWNKWSGTPLASNPKGTVWLRRSVTLTKAQAQSAAVLSLGIIDDLDMTFVNGKVVGNTFSWDKERLYRLPSGYLKVGVNEIMVAATNSWDNGGWTTGADSLALNFGATTRIPLGEGWRYAVAPVSDYPPRTPWDGIAGIGVMHNKMIAPLGHIALKGAAWYQGESDVGQPGYQDRLRELFAGWRGQFGPQMRMLVVQLANYGPAPHTAPVASGWGALREDQRQAVLSDGNAALVTAIDLGERTDIHPTNKVELGRRLAMAAQGEALPLPLSAGREGDAVRVRFSGVSGGLAAWSGGPIGFELCGADQASCRWARGEVAGDSVLIAGDGKPATRVRYAWGDSPVVNLNDARPLPVPGFELPIAAQ